MFIEGVVIASISPLKLVTDTAILQDVFFLLILSGIFMLRGAKHQPGKLPANGDAAVS